jgi:hypothetical protein
VGVLGSELRRCRESWGRVWIVCAVSKSGKPFSWRWSATVDRPDGVRGPPVWSFTNRQWHSYIVACPWERSRPSDKGRSRPPDQEPTARTA